MASTPTRPSPRPEETSVRVPLIDDDVVLDKYLTRLEIFLKIFGFCQYNLLSTTLSWLAFVALAVALPFLTTQLFLCSHCDKYEIRAFELEILVFQSIAAAVSLLCISHNLRKYGVRKLLFVDRYHGHILQFRQQYIQKIKGFYSLLFSWVILCFILKMAREVTRLIYLHDNSWWPSLIIFTISLLSWFYSTIIFFTGAALFNLVGNLQVIHFENYGKLLERDLDVSIYIEEHMRLTNYLSKLSHRFRLFLLLEFLIVSASQFMSLLATTGNPSIVNFINAGDFAVLSIVHLVGLLLCLTAAAKISHRAQGLGSVASRWHALVTCNSVDTSLSISENSGNIDIANPLGSSNANYSESDLESSDYVLPPPNIQLTSNMSSYHKRQAFVSYVQSNTGGFTIFGWTIDRVLINTIFFIELSLAFFVLGKTITITAAGSLVFIANAA